MANRPSSLQSFTEEQKRQAHELLASRVATMMGRKFEEGDWADVYCRAKGIPNTGWSNLKIDVMHEGLGVEHKMLCARSKPRIAQFCGETLMHPAATRAIRIPSVDGDATKTARDVLRQYADLIEARRQKVQETRPDQEPDMRTGWLLWQESLREFLYFEEEMLAPIPDQYYAEWHESGGGDRKKSKNLWVYEADTGQKRYSITTSAGAKIQPYFDVPPPNDPNVHMFVAQGEIVARGLVRIWVTITTAISLEQILGDLDTKTLNEAIALAAVQAQAEEEGGIAAGEEARPVLIASDAYELLCQSFAGVSDEHRMQLLIRQLNRAQ